MRSRPDRYTSEAKRREAATLSKTPQTDNFSF